MRKQEKIIEAWGVHYAPDIDENGLRKYSEFDKHLLYQWSDDWFLKSYNEISKEWCVIPKSLKGIDTNNGWIKIESEADYPKQSGIYHTVLKEDLEQSICTFSVGDIGYYHKYWRENVMYYQGVKLPNPPIY